MPDTVYVIGAGASYGESLVPLPNLPAGHPELHHHQPPLTNGFFAGELLHAIAYEQAEQDFPEAMQYVRRIRLVEDRFGEGKWHTINLPGGFHCTRGRTRVSKHGGQFRSSSTSGQRRTCPLHPPNHRILHAGDIWQLLQGALRNHTSQRFCHYVQLGSVVRPRVS